MLKYKSMMFILNLGTDVINPNIAVLGIDLGCKEMKRITDGF